ncbi:MAG: hypothetical protein OET18_12555 [Desulfobacterales bacterium]|nr:hypothetical protein [Desulfobacterales bacterium]
MALTENQEIKIYPELTRWKQEVAAGAIHFFKNAICNFNAAGFVKLGTDTAGEKFAGIALQELDQAASAATGDNEIKLIPAKSGEVVELDLTGVAITDIGADVFVNGDDLVALAATTNNDVRVGVIVALSETSNKCLVKLN